jgi:cytochrome c oxidase subunit 4
MTAHTSSRRAYVITFILLMILLAATLTVAHWHLGHWALPAALGIATIKLGLIAAFFMHLNQEPSLVRLFASVGLFWLGLLFVLISCDYLTRA